MSSIMGADFARLLGRDLNKMIEQVRAYPDEESLWRTVGTIKNGAGTLALHTVGNLEHFVGSVLGGSAYVRDRQAEFEMRDVPRDEIIQRLEHCRDGVVSTLRTLDDARMSEPYPFELPPRLHGSVHWFLVHLSAHTNWHLGQIDYHRRILAGEET